MVKLHLIRKSEVPSPSSGALPYLECYYETLFHDIYMIDPGTYTTLLLFIPTIIKAYHYKK